MNMFVKILNYDMKNGVGRYWKRYLAAVIAIGVFIAYSIVSYRFFQIHMGNDVPFSFLDIFLDINKGMKKIVVSNHEKFIYPVAYLAKGILLGVLVGEYYEYECKNMGIKILLSAQSRTAWIAGKIVRALAIPVIYNFLLIFFCMAASGFRFSMNEVFLAFHGIDIEGIDRFSLFMLCVLPFLTDLFFCVFQNLLCLFINSHLSFIAVMAVRFTSIFAVSIFLPGNWEMLLRNEEIMVGGLSSWMVIVAAIFSVVLMVIMNIRLFQKKDIL